MRESPVFDYVCDELEQHSPLDRLAVRGTVRIALKQAGLQASRVTAEQMMAVVDEILPGELRSRGVETSTALCDSIRSGLGGLETTGSPDTRDEFFERLGR